MKTSAIWKVLPLAAAVGLVGCGGSGSDSGSTNDVSIGGGNINAPTGSYTIAGKAADGYLVKAEVCADLNANGLCDKGEPASYSSAGGNFTLEIPEGVEVKQVLVKAVSGVTIDEDFNAEVTKSFSLSAPVVDDTQVFVSPLTTMVLSEMNATNSDAATAAKTVAERLSVDVDPLGDFIEGKKSADKSVQLQYEALHRIAQISAQISANVEEQLAKSGSFSAEAIAQVQQRIAELAGQIAISVKDSFTQDKFDPEVIAGSPSYSLNDVLFAIENGTSETQRRLLGADVGLNPFLSSKGEASTLDSHEIFLSYDEENKKVHFRSFEDSYDSDASSPEIRVSHRREITAVASGNYFELSETPEPLRAYNVWASTTGTFETVQAQANELGERYYFEESPGMISGAVYSGRVKTASLYKGFSLRYIGESDVIYTLFGAELPRDLFSGMNMGIYPDRTFAYSGQELITEDLLIMPWSSSDGEEVCGAFQATGSCNLLYPGGLPSPAKNIAEMIVPASAGTPGFDVSSDHGIVSHGDKTYAMYLMDDNKVLLHRSDLENSLSEIAYGSWEKRSDPTLHVKLNLPAGFEIKAARNDFHVGYPALVEHEGYVRLGWFASAGTNTANLFGRSEMRVLVNTLARNRLVSILEKADLLSPTVIQD
ncbi:hypothetical protein [Hydrocarboniclastica marina]|uniref:Uncharacterized protein n=1 Tax=Hydrocarboniclastica marina TaxID=2259620 RepID=A0A4P7XLQ7_9ALTE|nr:hypothetical protein [Hydrocarboniclastica marina]QCF28111.1 hypothetical protein soil367_18745 [Hydrocarboniclastica marina]